MFKLNKPRTSKYNATKTVIDGITFDSKLESNVYTALSKFGFKPALQVEYVLQDSFKDGKKTIRPITYVADFVVNRNDCTYIMDAKGLLLPEAKLKYKLMLHKGWRVLYLKSVKSAVAVGDYIVEGKTPCEIEDILNDETRQNRKTKRDKKLKLATLVKQTEVKT